MPIKTNHVLFLFLSISLIWTNASCTTSADHGGESTTLRDSDRKRPDLGGEEPEYELSKMIASPNGDFLVSKSVDSNNREAQGLALLINDKRLYVVVQVSAQNVEIFAALAQDHLPSAKLFSQKLPLDPPNSYSISVSRMGEKIKIAIDDIQLFKMQFESFGSIDVAAINDKGGTNFAFINKKASNLESSFSLPAEEGKSETWELTRLTNAGFEFQNNSQCQLVLIIKNGILAGQLPACARGEKQTPRGPCNWFARDTNGRWIGTINCESGKTTPIDIVEG